MDKKRLRRILFLHQASLPHEWDNLLWEYADDVVYVSLDNYGGLDYFYQMVADCAIFDSRIKDLFGAGMANGICMRRNLPALVFYDERSDNDYDRPRTVSGGKAVLYKPEIVQQEITDFLKAIEPFKPREDILSGLTLHPQTLSFGELAEIAHTFFVHGDEQVAEEDLPADRYTYIRDTALAGVTASIRQDEQAMQIALDGLGSVELAALSGSLIGLAVTLLGMMSEASNQTAEELWESLAPILRD